MAWSLVGVSTLFARSLAMIGDRAVFPTASTTDATNFPAPDDMWAVVNSGGPALLSRYPVVLLGDYTFWPLSYNDNRFSFAVAVTDSEANIIINVFEAPGARYIDHIIVVSTNETVFLYGQGGDFAEIAWEALSSATTSTVPNTNPTQSSTAAGTTTTTTTTGTASSSPTSSPSANEGSSLSKSDIIGICVGIPSFIATAVGVFLTWRYAKRAKPEGTFYRVVRGHGGY
ncbi:hypothetical protein B0H67DRAFT_566669 [Lasiosphaeris hirsuta]|uniref:Uncharacterized protein n=1 Tax=Lasiosphaeris hirsuta TaxID=260670 RepID=A0AA40E9T2_9PEZI|nr:hypothetical protein B0H67DRAFT_566669 [Lasiosphaeris hirsuta]